MADRWVLNASPVILLAKAEVIYAVLERSDSLIDRAIELKFTGSATDIVPKGHLENSPAFQRWVKRGVRQSPEGTVESMPQTSCQPSLRDFYNFPVTPGVETPGYFRLSLRDKATGSIAKPFLATPKCIRVVPQPTFTP